MTVYVSYVLVSGVDQSHLVDSEWFDRLKDAKARVKNLEPTPFGTERPYHIERHEYYGSLFHGSKIIKSNYINKS